ncbi:MAG: hypothetical protein Q8M76_03335, partial [Spirochaetaceae bacterium]|nr:hypothetical protein [Spirochaetaceae bacterium]
MLEDFFQEIDARWGVPSPGRIRLRVIGSSALMLQTGYARGTKDSDVLETNALTDDVKARLLALAGRGTAVSDRHGIYLDIVSRGLPGRRRPRRRPRPRARLRGQFPSEVPHSKPSRSIAASTS